TIMGNDTQSTVARAQMMLDAGNVDGAVAELQTLQGPARETAQPLIDKALITAAAQQAQSLLTNNVLTRLRGAAHPVFLQSHKDAATAEQDTYPEQMPP